MLQGHHKDGQKGNDSKENILTACCNCHLGLIEPAINAYIAGLETPFLKTMLEEGYITEGFLQTSGKAKHRL
jgi:hypothetical protein